MGFLECTTCNKLLECKHRGKDMCIEYDPRIKCTIRPDFDCDNHCADYGTCTHKPGK